MHQTIAIIFNNYHIPSYLTWLTKTISPPSTICLMFIIPDYNFCIHDPIAMLNMCVANEREYQKKIKKATKTLNEIECALKKELKFAYCKFLKIIVRGDENRKIEECICKFTIDLVVIGEECKELRSGMWFGKSVIDVVMESKIPMLKIPKCMENM